MGLRMKFNLVLTLAFSVGLGLAGWLSYQILQDTARQEVMHNAQIMMESALAIRGYTVREIRPLLTLQMKRQFLPQSISAYAAQQNLRALREKYPEFIYREAALNPTNPNDRAVDWEADIIREFRNNPDRTELVAERQTPTGPSLVFARPLQINDQGCLTCHSSPDVAPSTLISKYGSTNGFGWKLGEIVGAQVVSVPMALPLQRADQLFTLFMGGLVAVFVVVLILLNVLLHFVVVRPVKAIARMADEVSTGQADVPEFSPKGRDEIASLVTSFNRMRRSLENAMKMLEE
jgi:HAMP domain-containing protein